MYTTLSPCDMCTGACVLYKVARVVIGENRTFVGGEAYLKERGIEVVVLQNVECEQLMQTFIKNNPEVWYVHAYNSAVEFSLCLSSSFAGTKILVSQACIRRSRSGLNRICRSTSTSSSRCIQALLISRSGFGSRWPRKPVDFFEEKFQVVRIDKWSDTLEKVSGY